MIPVGYMAKRMPQSAEWLRTMKESLTLDVYSVSSCVNDDFADYVDDWKHNGWWFFDSPTVIRTMSREHSIDLSDALLFYYEVYEFEFENGEWRSFSPSEGIGNGQAGIATPAIKRLDGYDVVTFWAKTSPEHSPLSCNGLANKLKTNSHCLFDSFEQAETAINAGEFTGGEPGALRIFAVFSVDWPSPSLVPAE